MCNPAKDEFDRLRACIEQREREGRAHNPAMCRGGYETLHDVRSQKLWSGFLEVRHSTAVARPRIGCG